MKHETGVLFLIGSSMKGFFEAQHPGQLIKYSYSDRDQTNDTPRSIKVVQWNIERAYKLDEIINLLRDIKPDIIVIQEIDVFCERSNNRNSASELCQSLKMNGVFVVEFVELKSSQRTPKTQGGGWHGNGILSKFPIINERPIFHRFKAVDWDKDGHKFCEPRLGRRVALTAEVHALSRPIQVYSIHLEVFCGIFGRVKQFSDILKDCHQVISQGKINHMIVFGDLNTMAHGVARFLRSFCKDNLRWTSLGHSEAQWWTKNLFSVVHYPNTKLARYFPNHISFEELEQLWNPYLFDAHPEITTLQSYKGILYKGKLDWTLLRSFKVLNRGVANENFSCSDHKLLWVQIKPLFGEECAHRAYTLHQKESKRKRREIQHISKLFISLIVLIGVYAYMLCNRIKSLFN